MCRRLINTLRAKAPPGTAVDLAGALGEPRLVVEVLLDGLRDEGRVVFTNVPGGLFRIHRFG